MSTTDKGPWMYLLHGYRGGPDDEPYGLTDADALLADAAPELLAALENLLVLTNALSDEEDWQIEAARVAIAKAKGER